MFTIEQIKVIKMYRAVCVRRIEIPRSFCLRWSILTIGDIKLSGFFPPSKEYNVYLHHKKKKKYDPKRRKKNLKVNV